MTLSKTAVLLLRGLDAQGKKKLAGVLKIRMGSLYEYINFVEDSEMTSKVTNFLQKETGLSEEELTEGIELGKAS